MTLTLRWIAVPMTVAVAGCTAISGFDDLRKSGCATAVCDENTDSGISDTTVDSSVSDTDRDSSVDTLDDTIVIIDSTPVDGDSTVDSGVDVKPDTLADVDAAGLPCPTGKGAPMVRVVTTTPAGATYTFCIDKSEATNSHYEAFLAASPALSLQPAVCNTVNTTFTPTGTWPLVPAAPNRPVVNVDWCDAAAYCAWSGKRLCGRLGGGANPVTEQANPLSGEWMNACTKGDATMNKYPYGATYDVAKCNGASSGLVDVGSKAACEGAVSGLFDMSGNVYEWENSCGDLPTDNCFIRGGSYQTTSEDTLSCAGRATRTRNGASPNTGIRCCAD